MPWQRTDRARALVGGVERVGFLEGLRVDGDDRVDLRAVLVVGLDAIEVGTDERVGGEPPGLELGVDVLDGRLDDLERLRLGLRNRHAQADGRPGDGAEGDDGDARPQANPHLAGH